MPGSERPQKNPNQQTEPETTESDEETTTVPNADVQTTQPQPPEMNGEMPNFNSEFPAPPPNNVNSFGNASMLSMSN